MPDDLVRRLPEDPANPHRLGRHIHHDARSAAYPFTARPEAEAIIQSRGPWPRRIEVLDQGNLGSCTGNAGAGWVGTDNTDRAGIAEVGSALAFARGYSPTPPSGPVNEAWAVDLYSAATEIDPWPDSYPPDDTGSDGVSVATVLKTWGLVAEYTHAFGGLLDVLTALQSGPVMLGCNWYDSMFDPSPAGELVIGADAYVAGGHEFLLDGELDVDLQRVWMTNSWGPGWGQAGRAWLSYGTVERLLAEDGDATICHGVAVINPPPAPAPAGCLGQVARMFRRR